MDINEKAREYANKRFKDKTGESNFINLDKKIFTYNDIKNAFIKGFECINQNVKIQWHEEPYCFKADLPFINMIIKKETNNQYVGYINKERNNLQNNIDEHLAILPQTLLQLIFLMEKSSFSLHLNNPLATLLIFL